jgi:hypothetical protein
MTDERVRELANKCWTIAKRNPAMQDFEAVICTAIDEATAEKDKEIERLRKQLLDSGKLHRCSRARAEQAEKKIERLRYAGLRYDACKRSRKAWKARAEQAEAACAEKDLEIEHLKRELEIVLLPKEAQEELLIEYHKEIERLRVQRNHEHMLYTSYKRQAEQAEAALGTYIKQPNGITITLKDVNAIRDKWQQAEAALEKADAFADTYDAWWAEQTGTDELHDAYAAYRAARVIGGER